LAPFPCHGKGSFIFPLFWRTLFLPFPFPLLCRCTLLPSTGNKVLSQLKTFENLHCLPNRLMETSSRGSQRDLNLFPPPISFCECSLSYIRLIDICFTFFFSPPVSCIIVEGSAASISPGSPVKIFALDTPQVHNWPLLPSCGTPKPVKLILTLCKHSGSFVDHT